MLDRPQLKLEAKDILHSARVSPYLFTLLLMAVVLVLDLIERSVSGTKINYDALQAFYSNLQNASQNAGTSQMVIPDIVIRTSSFPPALVTFVGILVALVENVLEAGYAIYHLGIRRGREMPYSSLLDGFRVAGRVILLAILEGIFIVLWSLLFIIPGIIAAYRYRFALYNLLENPQLGPLDAISMSKQQTSGHKWDLFVLDLSFIGWRILCGLTLNILSIWITPYITQTNVGFFQAIKAEKGIGAFPGEDNAPTTDYL